MESRAVRELLEFVEAFHTAEGAGSNRSLYLLLINQGRRELVRAAGGVATTWENDTGGALTVSGNECAMPKEMISIESVWWDGIKLTFKPIEWIDAYLGDWRNERSGTPEYWTQDGRRILFDSQPSGSVTGLLVVHGRGLGEDLSEVEGAANPLDDLGGTDDLLVAYYAISRLPLQRVQPTSDDRAAIRAAAEENARRQATRGEHRQLWLDGKAEAGGAAVARTGRPYSGR